MAFYYSFVVPKPTKTSVPNNEFFENPQFMYDFIQNFIELLTTYDTIIQGLSWEFETVGANNWV